MRPFALAVLLTTTAHAVPTRVVLAPKSLIPKAPGLTLAFGRGSAFYGPPLVDALKANADAFRQSIGMKVPRGSTLQVNNFQNHSPELWSVEVSLSRAGEVLKRLHIFIDVDGRVIFDKAAR